MRHQRLLETMQEMADNCIQLNEDEMNLNFFRQFLIQPIDFSILSEGKKVYYAESFVNAVDLSGRIDINNFWGKGSGLEEAAYGLRDFYGSLSLKVAEMALKKSAVCEFLGDEFGVAYKNNRSKIPFHRISQLVSLRLLDKKTVEDRLINEVDVHLKKPETMSLSEFAKTHLVGDDYLRHFADSQVKIFKPTQKCFYGGIEVDVLRHYENGMYEVRSSGGVIVVDSSSLDELMELDGSEKEQQKLPSTEAGESLEPMS